MVSFDVNEAAEFLKMNPQVLCRKAKSGEVPARKVGKRWVFIREHLADFVSGRYTQSGQTLRVIDGNKGDTLCQSTNAAKRGGFNSLRQTEQEYSKLLGRN